ncbi:MAG TPA: hypothetical protein V6D47_17995 [Oscillatoriaceae cyanobacterium]
MFAGLKPNLPVMGAIALALAGCQAPMQPAPSASPSPGASAAATPLVGLTISGPFAPLDTNATFGTITAIDQQIGVSQVIYQVGVEDPAKKASGTADAHFVTISGLRYAVAPESWGTVGALKVGATANLYPSLMATVFYNPDGTTTSTRLMDVYPSSQAEPPLIPLSLTPAL